MKPNWSIQRFNLTRRKLLALFCLAITGSFVAGAMAFPVVVRDIFPISSSSVPVTPSHGSVEAVAWVIDPSSSTVEGVLLLLRNNDTVTHSFQIVVQVSCLSSGVLNALGTNLVFPPKPFNCAGGSAIIDSLGPGQTMTVGVNFDVAIEPERTQIENLSFIIQETPGPRCMPDYNFTTGQFNVTIARNQTRTVTKTITSVCDFAGTITFSAISSPSGLAVTIIPSTAFLPANGSLTVIETISAPSTIAPGIYVVTNTASDGGTTKSITITVIVL